MKANTKILCLYCVIFKIYHPCFTTNFQNMLFIGTLRINTLK